MPCVFAMCLLFATVAHAQKKITLEEAIAIGLENNFGIRVAKNEAQIANINHHIGESGYLPSISMSGEYSKVNDDLHIADRISQSEVNDHEDIHYRGASLSMDWKVFEGFWKITNHKKLGELEKLGRNQANIVIENTVLDITAAYYNIVRHERRIEVLNNTVEISEDRSQIARTKYELGAGSEYDLLVTDTDLNVDRTEVIREKLLLHSAKMTLVQLLDLDPLQDFEVMSEIELNNAMTLVEVREGALASNKALLSARLAKNVAGLERKEVFQKRFPEISFNASYNLSQEEELQGVGVHNIEKLDGYFYGLVARFNLFDGFKQNRRAQVAKIQYENRHYQENEQLKIIETTLLSNYENYKEMIALIELEKENLNLARKALEIALERFKLANITPVELRESQRTLLNTETRLITAMFEAKIHEMELLRLSGKLLDHYNIAPL